MASGQGILSLSIKDKNSLYMAYMPHVRNGGIFVPTKKQYSLGDEVFILLSIMEEKNRLPVAGKVVWITPQRAQGDRTPGIGVQFGALDKGATRDLIEGILAGSLQAERTTHTM